MNRRGFFCRCMRVLVAAGAGTYLQLPTSLLSYDPVKQEIVRPKVQSNDYLLGYKGASFLQTGYIIAPYFPLTTTTDFYRLGGRKR
jgi:hypothetical protein